MGRVLTPGAFVSWLDGFLPPMPSGLFAPLTEAVSGDVAPADRARLAALSFSRAHAMERIARALPAKDPRVAVWHRLSAVQAARGFALMRDDSAGEAWVPAFAILYLSARGTV